MILVIANVVNDILKIIAVVAQNATKFTFELVSAELAAGQWAAR